MNRAPYTPPSRPRQPQPRTVPQEAADAAYRMQAQGGSPKIQLEAARLASGRRDLGYKPHQGQREIARRAARVSLKLETDATV